MPTRGLNLKMAFMVVLWCSFFYYRRNDYDWRWFYCSV